MDGEILVGRALIEEIVVCIFDCGLSEDDAIEYMYSTLNNIEHGDALLKELEK